MSPGGEVTAWLRQLKGGDSVAAQNLWQGYFHRLVGLARKKLGDLPRRAVDEEDVALSAFDSFCRGAEQGRFPRLDDRDDLWQILMLLTARKAADLRQRETRLKRGGGQVRGESALLGSGEDDEATRAIDQIIGPEPTPEFAAQVAEQCRLLLDALGDEKLRSLALWKMEGSTNEEAATKLGCSLATVERKLRLIRNTWLQMVNSDAGKENS